MHNIIPNLILSIFLKFLPLTQIPWICLCKPPWAMSNFYHCSSRTFRSWSHHNLISYGALTYWSFSTPHHLTLWFYQLEWSLGVLFCFSMEWSLFFIYQNSRDLLPSNRGVSNWSSNPISHISQKPRPQH